MCCAAVLCVVLCVCVDAVCSAVFLDAVHNPTLREMLCVVQS